MSFCKIYAKAWDFEVLFCLVLDSLEVHSCTTATPHYFYENIFVKYMKSFITASCSFPWYWTHHIILWYVSIKTLGVFIAFKVGIMKYRWVFVNSSKDSTVQRSVLKALLYQTVQKKTRTKHPYNTKKAVGPAKSSLNGTIFIGCSKLGKDRIYLISFWGNSSEKACCNHSWWENIRGLLKKMIKFGQVYREGPKVIFHLSRFHTL